MVNDERHNYTEQIKQIMNTRITMIKAKVQKTTNIYHNSLLEQQISKVLEDMQLLDKYGYIPDYGLSWQDLFDKHYEKTKDVDLATIDTILTLDKLAFEYLDLGNDEKLIRCLVDILMVSLDYKDHLESKKMINTHSEPGEQDFTTKYLKDEL